MPWIKPLAILGALAWLGIFWATGAWAADCSVAITTGGTAQTLLAADGFRKSVVIHNSDVDAETLYVSLTSTATIPVANTSGSSFSVKAGGILTLSDPYAGELISVIAATTGHRVVCKRFGS